MSEIFAAQWDGEQMVPLPRFRKACDKVFVIGENYILETLEERSAATHRHFFAALKSAWVNLPEEYGAEYPTILHFRKRLLIEAGYSDVSKVVFSTAKDAIIAAALAMAIDDYSVTTVEGRVLTHFTAKSQSMKAMGKKDFQASKTAILELAATKIGTTPKELSATTPQAMEGE